jgi:uncharacterized membrane protein
MASTRMSASGADRLKWSFFGLMGLCVLLVIWVDERVWLYPADPHWKHLASVKGLLVVHALAGLTALIAGAFQFSSRLRGARPAIHRAIGRTYIGAVSVAAPMAVYIGTSTAEPVTIRFEQIFQGGFWWLSAVIGWACIRNRQVAMHKAWMMRSYGFTLIFVTSRVPDAFIKHYSDQFLSDMLWALVVVAIIAPELILTTQTLWRIHSAKARQSKLAPPLSGEPVSTS